MSKVFRNLLVISYILTYSHINAQNYEMGLTGGVNCNLKKLKYEEPVKGYFKIVPGFNIGGFLKTSKDRYGFLVSMEYQRIQNTEKSFTVLRNEFGDYIGGLKTNIINHELKIISISTIKLIDEFYFGIGISGDYILKPVVKFDQNLQIINENRGKRFNNYQYKTFTLSVPLQVGYEFNKIGVLFRFDKGIMNRIKGRESYLTEIDNTILLGLYYKII